jgi:hypothetical protein
VGDLGFGQVPALPREVERHDHGELLVESHDKGTIALDVPVLDVDLLEQARPEADGDGFDQGAFLLDRSGVVDRQVFPRALLLVRLAWYAFILITRSAPPHKRRHDHRYARSDIEAHTHP